jgi:hypothetical protein
MAENGHIPNRTEWTTAPPPDGPTDAARSAATGRGESDALSAAAPPPEPSNALIALPMHPITNVA